MASKQNKGGNVVNIVRQIAEPIAEELGLELWDVRFVKEGAEHYLRIFIDKEEGISIDDCVDMTHAIDEPLDKADPISVSYTLEVSSPGAERPLTRDEHFEKYIGAPIFFKLIRPLDGVREFKGTLESYDNGNVEVLTEDGKNFVFNKKEASYVKLDDFSSYID
ncbi:MAG: ribosome maturation factor RimP [Clostridia bacterium]|nr:ribosome maturation factor RimP [Clostridia bacterium]